MEGRLGLYVTSFFALCFAVAIVMSLGFSVFDGIGPWFSCSIGLVLSLSLLYSTWRKSRGKEAKKEKLVASEFNSEAMVTGEEKFFKRAGIFLVSVVVMYAGIATIGFPIALLLFIVIYSRWQGRIGWGTIAISVVASAAFMGYFSYALDLFWPTPLISLWVHLPQMLGGSN